MNTRFDGRLWIGALGVTFKVKEMETRHLLNTVKMLLQKPARVQTMLVADIESATFAEPQAWTSNRREDIRKVSVHNITSLSAEELVEYVKGTTLFNTMLAELDARGVNTENIMQLYTIENSLTTCPRCSVKSWSFKPSMRRMSRKSPLRGMPSALLWQTSFWTRQTARAFPCGSVSLKSIPKTQTHWKPAGHASRQCGTWNCLIWLTSICGPTGHEEIVADYTINIQLDYNALPDADSLAQEILNMLLAVRPSNMRVLMTAFLQSYGTLTHGACNEMSNYMEVWPHIINNIESNGSAAMVGALEYHATVEIYPKEQEV